MTSSGTISRGPTENWTFSRNWATAGPDRSSRSPRAQESLTVTTAAVSTVAELAIEQNVFLFILALAYRGRSGRMGDRHRGGDGRRRGFDRSRLRFPTTVTRRLV